MAPWTGLEWPLAVWDSSGPGLCEDSASLPFGSVVKTVGAVDRGNAVVAGGGFVTGGVVMALVVVAYDRPQWTRRASHEW